MNDATERVDRLFSRLNRVARIGIMLVSAILAATFLYVASRRLLYPYDVEWVESGMMTTVARLARGEPLYTAPTPDYVPFLYAPIYFYAAALMSKVVGVSMTALRAVSILASLGSCLTIFAFVYQETKQRLPAISASALFIGCYALAGQFYDIGRVDSLFVFLMLLALFAHSRGHPVLAAVLWVATFQTKQAVLPVGAFILCAEWRSLRKMFFSLGTYAILAGGSIALFNYLTHGWYSFYVFSTTLGLRVIWKQAVFFGSRWIIAPFTGALIVIVASLVSQVPSIHNRSLQLYVFVTAGLTGGIWFVAAHRGAASNAYIPLFAWIAILFGVSVGRLLSNADRAKMPVVATVVLAGVLFQLISVLYNPGDFIPNREARAKRSLFIEQLRSFPGDVYVFNHSWDAVLAGKVPHAEGEALGAVLDSKDVVVAGKLRREIAERIFTHAYSSVLVDADTSEEKLPIHIDEAYPVAERSASEGGFYLTSQPQWFRLTCERQELWSAIQPEGLLDSRGCRDLATEAFLPRH